MTGHVHQTCRTRIVLRCDTAIAHQRPGQNPASGRNTRRAGDRGRHAGQTSGPRRPSPGPPATAWTLTRHEHFPRPGSSQEPAPLSLDPTIPA